MHFTKGSREEVAAAEPEKVGSCVWFVTPISPDGFEPRTCQVQTRLGDAQIHFLLVESEKEDLIFQASKDLVLAADENGKPFVPTRHLLDNRGHYPCVAVEACFPMRVDGDTIRAPDTPITEDDRERMELLGPDPMPEKLIALSAMNRALKKNGLNNSKPISANEITALFTTHGLKAAQKVLAQTISLVTTPNAFKNAAEDYYLGDAREGVAVALASLRAEHGSPPSNEAELLSLVISAIDKVLVHHFETRRLIEPFWDGSRTIKVNGENMEVPKKPKNEAEIQPTLHVFLQMALEPFGVHVIRESDEGSGSLDFRFSTTNANSELVSVAAEFKLAHHKEVKAGVTRQLPRYMDSIPCSRGVFILMWFKDEAGRYFSEPKVNDLEQTRKFLSMLAKSPDNPTHLIVTRVIDCSVRPSASKLR